MNDLAYLPNYMMFYEIVYAAKESDKRGILAVFLGSTDALRNFINFALNYHYSSSN